MLSQTKWFMFCLVVCGSLGACQPDPNAPPIYRDANEYQAALEKVQKLTKGPFEAMHEGDPVTEKEMEGLKEADHLIDGLIAFNANAYAPYILRGLTKRALGQYESAKTAYEQGLALAPKAPTENDIGALARIHDELGTLYFEQKKFEEAEPHADEAARLLPQDPSILTNTASVKVQLKKMPEAKALLDRALQRDPTYRRAMNLVKFIGDSSK